MATSFLKCAAIDVKLYIGKIILQLADHTTRLSTSCFATSKKPKAILNGTFRSWIQIDRMPKRVCQITGENCQIAIVKNISETLNIEFTAAEGPFSMV